MSIEQNPEDQKAMDELVSLNFLVGIAMVLLTGTGLTTAWVKGTTWLVEQQILVGAGDNPVLTAPNAAGAGLDLPRVVVLASAVVAAGAVLLSALLHRIRYHRRYL